jgi:glycosyltransferase involved in cell wall biosynthesis
MNIAELTKSGSAKEIVDMFPQFSFVILYVGTLDTDSTLFRAIDAARNVLYAQSIGLVVVGDGPRRQEFIDRTKILGISEQVVFLKDVSMVPKALMSADILLCTDTDETSDGVVIQSAAVGLPLLMAENTFRSQLFVDGEDAFMCEKDDTIGFSQKLNKFLNTSSLRTQFRDRARDMVTTRLFEDPVTFSEAYRASIESIFEQEVK